MSVRTSLGPAQFSEAQACRHTEESGLAGHGSSLLVREPLLVRFVGCESDCHLRNDTSQNGSETLVQSQCGFSLDNVDTSGNEPAWFNLGQACQPERG